jgi:hypothetical protein
MIGSGDGLLGIEGGLIWRRGEGFLGKRGGGTG